MIRRCPQKEGDYLYWWAYETGSQYPRWWRQARSAAGADELILDEPMPRPRARNISGWAALTR
jgi:protease II